MSITLITVVSAREKAEGSAYLSTLSGLLGDAGVTTRLVVSDDPVRAILREAERDYDLLVLGTPTVEAGTHRLFGRVIDDLVKLSPCPSLLVRGVETGEGVRRILVPTNGTRASRRAAELAFAIADSGTVVEGLHVVTPSIAGGYRGMVDDVAAELELVGRSLGRAVSFRVCHDDSSEAGILSSIEETQPDLVILGTEVRAGTARLHLGPRVERLVREATSPVVVLNG